jgi:hypothetical protein
LFPDQPAAFSGAAWRMPRMNTPVHPGAALFKVEKPFPAILLAAQQAGWGPIQYAGESHDRATYRYYWNVLQKARTTGVPVPADADRAFLG